MRRSKTFAVMSGGAAIVVALAACGGGGGGNQAGNTGDGKPGSKKGSTVLNVAFNQNIEHPQAQSLLQASDQIYDATQGKYSLQLFTDETLGDQKATIEQLQAGSLAFTIVASPLLESFEPQMAVVNLPYLFTSPEQQVKVLNDKKITGPLYDLLKPDGIQVVSAYHAGVRNMYTKAKQVEKPSDLNGLKIRVIPSETNLAMIKAFGGAGTPMAAGEIVTALQSGVIDGAENNEITYNDQSHVESAKFYSYTKHLMLPDYLMTSTKVWDGLDDATKTAMTTAFDKSVQTEFGLWQKSTERATAAAKTKGATFKEVDVEPFRKLALPLHDKLANAGITKTVYDAITAAK